MVNMKIWVAEEDKNKLRMTKAKELTKEGRMGRKVEFTQRCRASIERILSRKIYGIALSRRVQ